MFSAEQVEVLKASATSLGLDSGQVADIITKWGPKVLATIVEALRGGLTVNFVMEVINTFGPTLLDFVVDFFNLKKMFSVGGTNVPGIIEGIEVNINGEVEKLDGNILLVLLSQLIDKFGPELVTKILPSLLEKYGPIIVQFVMDWLLKQMEQKKVSFSN